MNTNNFFHKYFIFKLLLLSSSVQVWIFLQEHLCESQDEVLDYVTFFLG
jgi:hypothetical protein